MGRARSAIGLVVSILVCLLAGALGSVATASSVNDWYVAIDKPSWTPPGAVFGPVWTALYVLMGISAWQVWREESHPERRSALAIFGLQLLLNALWSFLFFGLRSPRWAAIEILLLWLAIVAAILAFLRIRRSAAFLLVPYLLWVSFATALNLSIWSLNR